ncbi:hypothetical protein CCACVL1_10422 [Corchorus capsularis]|uniref:non-specific serine/threonine protein kinase n=1 Tax=Corchorus capsularis TaxID=210143 RepID=A0A1R3IR65_COCAP|nr:hypothetical protein CCACVL1_10422 [Corchorus capsularis]
MLLFPTLNFLSLFNTLLLSCIVTWQNLHSPAIAATILNGNETDRLALLAIKAQITDDTLGLMSSWNDSVHFCNWGGIICGRLHQRVITLNLNNHNLVGSLSPHVGNLTFLRGLGLEVNNFHGQIPPEIGRLTRLRHLNLSNNSFSGEIPANLSGCSSLIFLRLGFNNLIGKIPYQLGYSLQKLERFHLHYNNLSGSLPASLGNLSSVKSLSFSVNSFQGSIPDELGKLKTLNFLGLGLNQLTGIVPSSLLNLSSLSIITLPFNQLQGTLPSNLGFTLPNLSVLNIGHNLFTGPLPASLSNASNLIEFDINGSNFTGKVNIDFAGLPGLWWLVLASNPLNGDLDFLNSLTKCRNLQVLDLSFSQFGGVIPSSIGNLSTELVQLRLGGNHLRGSLPMGIKNLINLTDLTMEKNNLTGNIPSAIGNLKMLRRLDLSENQFSGNIPSSIANITELYMLHLQKNNFTGNIPSSFGNLNSLQDLDLSQNHLSGTIPKNVISLSSLTISLNLAQNQLTGPLPSEVSNLKNLGHLDLSENQLSGEIPSGLGSCVTLENLYMEGNFFEGSIPDSLRSLRGLENLDFSRNNLSGQIPEYLQHFSLMTLNLSFNEFEGPVPTSGVFKNATAVSIKGNQKLCGGIPELKLSPCSSSNSKKGKMSHTLKFMIGLIIGLLGLVLIMSLLIIYRLRRVKKEPAIPPTSSSIKKDLFLKVSYDNLLKATDGFASENLIGAGSFGSVYKGTLDQNETIVAVKVLYLHQRGALKSFMTECQTLSNVRHRNLVKLLTSCSSIDFQGNEFKALVYEFMPNGSLESWLHPVDDLKILSLIQRVNIAIDVASALEYLHNYSHKPIVHRDLKPSNILLDNDMTAHVSDFGLAKFMLEAMERSHLNQSSSAGLKGTLGYAAPEYGMGGLASTYGDIYSYGILVLEMFTGKRPTDEMFKDGLDLHNFVKTALPEGISEVVDPLFVAGREGQEEEESGRILVDIKKDQLQASLGEILRIGVACSVESPRERMKLNDVVKELQLVKSLLLGTARLE